MKAIPRRAFRAPPPVRIAFDAPTDFPLMAKIRVTGPYGLSNLVESALGAFVPRGEAEAAPAKKIIGN